MTIAFTHRARKTLWEFWREGVPGGDDGDDDDDDDGDGDDDGDVQGRKSTSNGTFQILNQKPNFIGGWMKICKILFCQKFH